MTISFSVAYLKGLHRGMVLTESEAAPAEEGYIDTRSEDKERDGEHFAMLNFMA